jgi:hypothetical protein
MEQKRDLSDIRARRVPTARIERCQQRVAAAGSDQYERNGPRQFQARAICAIRRYGG